MYSFKLFILILFYSSVLGYPTNNEWLNLNIITDEDLNFNSTLLECELDCWPINKPVRIKYHLFTRKNPLVAQTIVPADINSIEISNYNVNNPTRLVVHGWSPGKSTGPDTNIDDLLVKTYLEKSDFNVIFIDWTACSKTVNYFKARCCVENVGKQVAELIDILNKNFKLNFNNLIVIGHSLGAHVMGYAGKNVKNGKINTIIGLDAAKPCFVTDIPEERLANTDALYVETIHTNGNGLGFMTPIGNASFYPNWGKIQKGCVPFPISTCSHSLSYEYYAESILENNFFSIKCDNYDKLLNKDCTEETDIKMGGEPSNQNKRINGIFYLETNKNVPFGMG